MSFRLPSKLNSKRASSFHSKKLALPGLNPNEETENIFSRKNSKTPNSTKNQRALSYIEVKHSPGTPTQNNLHKRIYETPVSKEYDHHSNSMIDSKSTYIHELIDKLASQKPIASRINEEIKKNEEKNLQKIDILTKEIDYLQLQIKKLKGYKNNEKKKDKLISDMRIYTEKFRTTIEDFIRKIRENTEKLCNFVSLSPSKCIISEINSILSAINEDLDHLSPYISQETIITNQFLIHEQDVLENTGRFKSLGDTQNSFGVSNNSIIVKEVIALADFKAKYYGELAFKVGDRIQLIKTDDPNWWLGKIGDKVGRIPSQLVMLD